MLVGAEILISKDRQVAAAVETTRCDEKTL